MLGESMFHINAFRPAAPDSISAVFDSVLRRDSTLFPALIHPMDLGITYRDSARFERYFPRVARTAAPSTVAAIRTTADLIWGPRPTSKAIAAAVADQPSRLLHVANSAYHWDQATSDSIAQQFAWVQRAAPHSPQFLARALALRALAFAGMGRWREAHVLVDSLKALDPEKARGIRAWSMALGLAPVQAGFLDSLVKAFPPGPQAEYAGALLHLFRGQVREGRSRIARALAARDSRPLPPEMRGLMEAVDGWGMLLQGDSVAGIRRLRAGIDTAASPGMTDETSFFRFQLGLALAERPETRAEGIRWLKFGFELQPLYLPLTQLALGRTYDAAGQGDSAAVAYRRFLRFWNKADPEMQGRVGEAREALKEVTRERPESR
jgi:hypothetical protein